MGFLTQLGESIDDVVAKEIKVITNAGALNPRALSMEVEQLCRARGHRGIVVATIVGDDVSDQVIRSTKSQTLPFRHLDHDDQLLRNWDQDL